MLCRYCFEKFQNGGIFFFFYREKKFAYHRYQGWGRGGGGGRRLVKFSYQNHPTKIDVTSGLIGTQQPVSAKSNDGVWVRHDLFGF